MEVRPLTEILADSGTMPDAFVYEEDLELVLSTEPSLRGTGESYSELYRAAASAPQHMPGRVVVRGHRPMCLLAVVHDLAREPTWREEWIVAAVESIFRVAREHELATVAFPLLGTVHGDLDPSRAAELMIRGYAHAGEPPVTGLWLHTRHRQAIEKVRASLSG